MSKIKKEVELTLTTDGKIKKRFTCECGKEFTRKFGLERHILTVCQGKIEEDSEESCSSSENNNFHKEKSNFRLKQEVKKLRTENKRIKLRLSQVESNAEETKSQLSLLINEFTKVKKYSTVRERKEKERFSHETTDELKIMARCAKLEKKNRMLAQENDRLTNVVKNVKFMSYTNNRNCSSSDEPTSSFVDKQD